MDPPQVDSLAEKEDRILDRLDARLGRPFFRDGAVDPAEYCYWRTWNTVARWTYGLSNGLSAWDALPPMAAGFRFRMLVLRRVAVVNVNKRGGGSSRIGAATDRWRRSSGRVAGFASSFAAFPLVQRPSSGRAGRCPRESRGGRGDSSG